MVKEIRLNAFDMNCVVHQSAGLWRHPRDRSDQYTSLDYWVELAKLLERGKFDALFIADVLGVYDVYGGNVNSALAEATQIPLNDPVLLIPAMSHATSNLGFGVTCTLSFEPPYPFARRMSTLDHLTKASGIPAFDIIRHYHSKENILAAVLERELELIAGSVPAPGSVAVRGMGHGRRRQPTSTPPWDV